MTDKGSMIRARIYKKFQNEIQDAYDKFSEVHQKGPNLGLEDLEVYLKATCHSVTRIQITDPATDFFNAGMDSLQAIQLRTQICKDLRLGGLNNGVSENIVFETGSISKLASLLLSLSHNLETKRTDELGTMKRMIEQYTQFPKQVLNRRPALQRPFAVSWLTRSKHLC